MRIIILGGTAFIGRAMTEYFADQGHEVLVVHRGETEPPGLPDVQHLHVDRSELAGAREAIEAFQPDAAVEVYAMNGEEAETALSVLPQGIRLVAISSCDVYRAYQSLHTGKQTDTLPLVETSPLRDAGWTEPMPVRGETTRSFQNLEVEQAYLARGAAVLRLSAVYGPHDGQRRFEFVLRRVRAGRKQIPIGAGTFLWSRVYVHDVAKLTLLALTDDAARGEIFNVSEQFSAPMRLHAQQVLDAVGSDAELVAVPDAALPPDLKTTGTISQHLVTDSAKARALLGWELTDQAEALRRSVRWHLENPPAEWSDDFSADDAALAAAATTTPSAK
jgi:nucleoside-diphosphate-sugar epimerase